uniref:Uncharacterized protein n=1 Tax=Arundo donax TaxID=35708 RepID=A0A0A9GKS8_ARUDO
MGLTNYFAAAVSPAGSMWTRYPRRTSI